MIDIRDIPKAKERLRAELDFLEYERQEILEKMREEGAKEQIDNDKFGELQDQLYENKKKRNIVVKEMKKLIYFKHFGSKK